MKKVISVFSIVLFAACQTGPHLGELSTEKFQEQINNPHVQVLDVRTKEEYDLGHIANAELIDVQESSFDQETKRLYKDLPVYVYCKKGARSHTAAEKLKALGFKEVYELQGGFDAWRQQNLPFTETVPEKIYENDTIPFLEAIKGDKLVMVDFNAVWCGPCKELQPRVEKIHDTRSDDVIVYSIDVDKNKEIAMEYGAQQIPLLLWFKNNEIVHRFLGSNISESELNALVDKLK